MFFKYDTVIDVKNVNEYTITGLTRCVTYYLARTAYADPNTPNQESAFSIELTHFVDVIAPAQPLVLRFKIQPPTELEIIDGPRSDSIKLYLRDLKEIHEEK